jgi:hypothetical protein
MKSATTKITEILQKELPSLTATRAKEIAKRIAGTEGLNLKEIIEVLQCLHTDAQMALRDDWDRTDHGFECQIRLIDDALPCLGAASKLYRREK